MRRVLLIGVCVWLGLLPSALAAAPLDGSAPMLCALTSVVECPGGGQCERRDVGEDVPVFWRVNVPQRLLSSLDGARSSPIANVQRESGQLMLQGIQNGKVWGLSIDERSGQMAATVGEADGGMVLAGACTVP
jgi:hypothetical protein